MSNPLFSLRKAKKTPLVMPELANQHFSAQSPDVPEFSSDVTPPSLSPFQSSRRSSIDQRSNHVLTPSMSNGFLLSAPGIKKATYLTPLNKAFSNENTPRGVPFKSKIDDSDLLDETTTRMAVNNIKRNVRKETNDKAPNDMELMQIMMNKIKITEAKCAHLEKELREKNKLVDVLTNKLEIYKKANYQLRDEAFEQLEKENLDLLEQIHDMENFLADYGLFWVGETKKEKDKTVLTQTDEEPTEQVHFRCDYDLIIKNINDLNSLTDYNEPKIVDFKQNAAKFETQHESIKLTLFLNGISLFNGPFRSFNDALTQKFCIDIMDGYFPSELQEKYPDGVFINLIDKRNVAFVDPKKGSSNGLKNIQTQLNENPLTLNQFFDQLPNSVIRNGKVIDIRNDLSHLLTKNKPDEDVKMKRADILVIQTPTLIDLKMRYGIEKSEDELLKLRHDGQHKLSTLRVKSVEEDLSYILKLKSTNTIQDVKDLIKTERKSNQEFELASIHPHKVLDDPNSTLEQCDLVPNSNIILIVNKNKK